MRFSLMLMRNIVLCIFIYSSINKVDHLVFTLLIVIDGISENKFEMRQLGRLSLRVTNPRELLALSNNTKKLTAFGKQMKTE